MHFMAECPRETQQGYSMSQISQTLFIQYPTKPEGVYILVDTIL